MQPVQRDITLDIAKGISILLMTISHFILFTNYPVFLDINKNVFMIFKMPLFIFISGLLFKNKLPFSEFVRKKFNGLLKPTISIVIASSVVGLFVLWFFVYKTFSKELFEELYDKLVYWYTGLWFPISLFFGLVLFKLLLDIKEKRSKLVFLLSLLLMWFGLLFLYKQNIYLFLFKAYSVIFFVALLACGYYFKKSGYYTVIYKPAFFIVSLLIFSLSCYYKIPLGVEVDLHLNVFGTLYSTIPALFAGIACVLFISKQLSKQKQLSALFIACSKSSFFILAFHIVIGNTILYNVFYKFLPQSVWIDVVLYVLSITLCIAIHKITRKSKLLSRFLLP